jgi:hypothetical protein
MIERDLNQLKKTNITGNANYGKQNKTHSQKMRCNKINHNFHKFALTVLPVTNTLHKTVINNPLNEASYIAVLISLTC